MASPPGFSFWKLKQNAAFVLALSKPSSVTLGIYCIGAKVPRKSYVTLDHFALVIPVLKTATISPAVVFRKLERLARSLQALLREAEVMESVVVSSDVRQLCKAVSEEQDSKRLKALLDELLRVLDEHQLLAALF